MSDAIECLGEVNCKDPDKWIGRLHGTYSVQESNKCSSGRSGRPKGKLVCEA